MTKLYKKSEIAFAIVWIVLYIAGTIVADEVSVRIGAPKSITAGYHLLLTALLLTWIFLNKLHVKYGLCKAAFGMKSFLYFLPLLVLISTNFWLGVEFNLNLVESILFFVSMLCVGFIEEIIFRGFLFKAMEKSNLKAACIVSSLTFGIGHIINLIMGNGTLVSNICQIFYAIAVGFLFVILFYKGKSLLPCIITHSLVNAFSLFLNQSAMTTLMEIITSVVIILVSVLYSIYLIKKIPNKYEPDFIAPPENNKENKEKE